VLSNSSLSPREYDGIDPFINLYKKNFIKSTYRSIPSYSLGDEEELDATLKARRQKPPGFSVIRTAVFL